MNKVKCLETLTRPYESDPRPTTKFNFSLPFGLLIAVLLSARATGVSVNKATAKLHPVASTSAAMPELGIEGVKTYIETIGLYSSKAESIIKACRILLGQHNGGVPEDHTALETLPGVGRRTTNVVLSTAFGWPTVAVDTHIFHVCNHTQFIPGKNIEQVEERLLKVAPVEFRVDCHHWLTLHRRYACIARKPRCDSCIIENLCEYKERVDIWGKEITPITPLIAFLYPLLKHPSNVNDTIAQHYHQVIRLRIAENAG